MTTAPRSALPDQPTKPIYDNSDLRWLAWRAACFPILAAYLREAMRLLQQAQAAEQLTDNQHSQWWNDRAAMQASYAEAVKKGIVT